MKASCARDPDGDAAIRILIVDDDPTTCLLLRSFLEKRGSHVLQADNGVDGIALYREHAPDLVLMDVMMPELDGLETTRLIRDIDPDHASPILFITALDDERQLAACVAAGGDDFLSKPVSRIQLDAKLDSWLRIQDLYQVVRRQRDALDALQQLNQQDKRLAGEVRDCAASIQRINQQDGLSAAFHPADILGGDFLVLAHDPSGRCFLLLGDFTGHGMAAAMGVVPVAQTLERMAALGADAEDILTTLNRDLVDYLPVSLFLSMALLVIEPGGDRIRIWNAGMPDLVCVRAGDIVHRVASALVPLGVQRDMPPFAAAAVELPIEGGDCWVGFSDGLLESVGDRGEALGQQGVEQALLGDWLQRDDFEDALQGHAESSHVADDLTIFRLEPARLAAAGGGAAGGEQPLWRWRMSLHAEQMRNGLQGPSIAASLACVHPLSERAQRELGIVLGELLNNALEHGVLGLDSSLKDDASGFSAYYGERERRLRTLQGGMIHLDIRCYRMPDTTHALRLFVIDSGDGFDYRRRATQQHNGTLAGRGLSIVEEFCTGLRFLGRGNALEAEYRLGGNTNPIRED